MHANGTPVIERAWAQGVTDDGRIHAVPFPHWSLTRFTDGPVKLRCGDRFGVPNWDETWSPRQFEPALCARCIELTTPFAGGVPDAEA
jgi:hypothetical protein